MLRFEDVKVGDIIRYYDTKKEKFIWDIEVVTQLTDHSNLESCAKYVTIVTSREGRLDTGALADYGFGIEPPLDGVELKIVGHTDLADRLAETFENSLGWMKDKEVA